jgi:hypothetical protein
VTWTNDLLTGMAQAMAADGIGTFGPGHPTTSTACAITLGTAADEPIKAVALFAYSPVDDVMLANTMQPVQIRIRGTVDATSCDTIGDAIFDLFHGVTGLVFGTVHTSLIARNSVIPLGRDDHDRWMSSHNYYVHANRPTASRPD